MYPVNIDNKCGVCVLWWMVHYSGFVIVIGSVVLWCAALWLREAAGYANSSSTHRHGLGLPTTQVSMSDNIIVNYLHYIFFPWIFGAKTVTYHDRNRSKIVITGSQNDKSIKIDRLTFYPDHDNTNIYICIQIYSLHNGWHVYFNSIKVCMS